MSNRLAAGTSYPHSLDCRRCGGGMARGYPRSGICRRCRVALKEARWREIQRLWARGSAMSAIALTVDCSENHLGTEMARMRKAGWDLPYRYRVERGA